MLIMHTTSPAPLPSTPWEAAVSHLHQAQRLASAHPLDAELLCRDGLAVLLEIAPEIPEVLEGWMLLAELRFRDGDLGECESVLREVMYRLGSALHLDEDGRRMQVQALQRLGLVHAIRGELAQAAPTLRQARLRARRQVGPAGPEGAQCLTARAFVSRRAGHYDLAASQLREALRANTGPSLAAQLHRNLARLELDRGRPERGVPSARMALALMHREGEDAGAMQVLLAELLLATGETGEAEQLLQEVSPQLEGGALRDACLALAQICWQRGEAVQAELLEGRAGWGLGMGVSATVSG